MELNNFPFNSGTGFAWSDQLLIQALNKVITSIPCTIRPDTAPKYGFVNLLPHVSVFNWERDANNFCYGQFLEFDNQKGKKLKFWAGLDMQKQNQSDKVRFMLWFDHASLPKPSHLKDGYTIPNSVYAEQTEGIAGKSYWVALKDTDFTNYCQNPVNAPILSDFIAEVLNAV